MKSYSINPWIWPLKLSGRASSFSRLRWERCSSIWYKLSCCARSSSEDWSWADCSICSWACAKRRSIPSRSVRNICSNRSFRSSTTESMLCCCSCWRRWFFSRSIKSRSPVICMPSRFCMPLRKSSRRAFITSPCLSNSSDSWSIRSSASTSNICCEPSHWE